MQPTSFSPLKNITFKAPFNPPAPPPSSSILEKVTEYAKSAFPFLSRSNVPPHEAGFEDMELGKVEVFPFEEISLTTLSSLNKIYLWDIVETRPFSSLMNKRFLRSENGILIASSDETSIAFYPLGKSQPHWVKKVDSLFPSHPDPIDACFSHDKQLLLITQKGTCALLCEETGNLVRRFSFADFAENQEAANIKCLTVPVISCFFTDENNFFYLQHFSDRTLVSQIEFEQSTPRLTAQFSIPEASTPHYVDPDMVFLALRHGAFLAARNELVYNKDVRSLTYCLDTLYMQTVQGTLRVCKDRDTSNSAIRDLANLPGDIGMLVGAFENGTCLFLSETPTLTKTVNSIKNLVCLKLVNSSTGAILKTINCDANTLCIDSRNNCVWTYKQSERKGVAVTRHTQSSHRYSLYHLPEPKKILDHYVDEEGNLFFIS